MPLTALASRLLNEVEAAQRALLLRGQAAQPAADGIAGVRLAIGAALLDLSDEQLLASPSPDEWSIAEVVEHLAEHDRSYSELERLGVEHYVEHGLEHALQLWKLRAAQRTAGGAK
ncbi:MAG TPA: DinB family protein [Dehalococcoidia bacterium]|nr:DinB family protein [Dehalococcoidia bacterium]